MVKIITLTCLAYVMYMMSILCLSPVYPLAGSGAQNYLLAVMALRERTVGLILENSLGFV